MRRRKEGIVIIIIVIIAVMIFFLMAKLSGSLKNASKINKQLKVQELATELSSYDYSVYWIGTPPDGLKELMGERLILVPVDSINDDTMPVGTTLSKISREDSNGYIYTEHSRNEYSDLLLIVINTQDELTSSDWDIIRKCVVDNNIPIELVGGTSINGFRRVMLMPQKRYEDGDSMFYSSNGVDILSLNQNEITAGGDDCNNAFLTFFKEVFTLPRPTPVVVESKVATVESESEEETETTLDTVVFYRHES
ncbi:MAG: hypothetical protein MJ093_07215 [Saccharofermentans sp.]|nr:hypothetical protein [Saccharofermentans sp.]